jgi:AraC family transcriptional regulator
MIFGSNAAAADASHVVGMSMNEITNIGTKPPTRPFVSRDEGIWQRIKLQRYEFPVGRLEIENPAEHCMTFQLGGPTFVESRSGGDVRGERFWLGHGQMSLIPAGAGAVLDLKGPSNIVLVRLQVPFLGEVAEEVYEIDRPDLSLRPSSCISDEKLRALCGLLLAEADKDTPGSSLMIESLGRAMALQLLRRHSSLAKLEPVKPAPLGGVQLRRVLKFMREHLDDALPIARLAKVAALSPSQFIRAFRKATGQSPHRYLINLRAQKARELLERTDLSVLEVGLQCGFEQPSHFATVFRSRMGMSPRDWRSAHRY